MQTARPFFRPHDRAASLGFGGDAGSIQPQPALVGAPASEPRFHLATDALVSARSLGHHDPQRAFTSSVDGCPDPLLPHGRPDGAQTCTGRVSCSMMLHGDSPPLRAFGYPTWFSQKRLSLSTCYTLLHLTPMTWSLIRARTGCQVLRLLLWRRRTLTRIWIDLTGFKNLSGLVAVTRPARFCFADGGRGSLLAAILCR